MLPGIREYETAPDYINCSLIRASTADADGENKNMSFLSRQKKRDKLPQESRFLHCMIAWMEKKIVRREDVRE